MKSSTFLAHRLLAVFLLFAACSSSQMKDSTIKAEETNSSNNVLIVYLSRTNNTKAIAEIIHKNVGGKLVALELEKPYP